MSAVAGPGRNFERHEGNPAKRTGDRGGNVGQAGKKNAFGIFRAVTAPAALLSLFFCDHPFKIPRLHYSPPIVFVGIVNGEYDSLPGNRSWPNTCTLHRDTLRMRFFSEAFTETNVRSGDFIRIDILPGSTAPLGYGTRNIIFHMARYRDANYSYQVIPKDTLWTINRISMHTVAIALEDGGTIDLDHITVAAKAMTGTEPLTIEKGRVFGMIE